MDKEFLEKCLNDGMSTRDIEKICNIDHRTISYWVNKYNLSQLSRFAKKDVYTFGKIDSKEKAYVLGFILADSGISEKNMVEIGIAIHDKQIIEFIANVINSNINYDHKLNTAQRRFPRVRTTKTITDVTKFTGGRLKADRHYPRVRDDLERYLIQGFFDADGCITWGHRKDKNRIWYKISFTSQYKILEGVQQYLSNKLNISSKLRPKGESKCFVLEFCNQNDVLTFCEHIYPDDSFIILKRKYLNYNALRLELEENGESNRSDCRYRAEPTE